MNSPGAYIYVLYGEDTFGRDEQVQSLKQRMRTLPAGEFNLTELQSDTSVANLRMAADAVPFLADRRMVIVHGLLGRLAGRGGQRRGGRGRAKTAESGVDELHALLEYLPDVPQSTSIAFVEDGRINPEPVERVIPRGRAYIHEYTRVVDVRSWVRKRARSIGVALDEDAVRELASVGGEDLRRLDSELRKLADYADGSTVSRTDVRQLVAEREVTGWALLDALSERRLDKALTALHLLYTQGMEFGEIFGGNILPHYHRLTVARELADLSPRELNEVDVGALGLNPATVKRWISQALGFDRSELERALEVLLELDRHIKLGETEPEPSLEVAVVRLCSRLTSG